MIQLHSVTKSYADKIILEDVSFTISNNKKIGLIAPNGTGKSTLFKIILGLEEPDKGSVSIQHEQIGYLSQSLHYSEDDTIYTFLKKVISEDWEEYKIDMALADVDLELDKDTNISVLSGGQRTKVGLAQLLIEEPTTLLLDEPTNNLDLQSMIWLEKFIKKFQGNVLVISHDRTFLDNTVQQIFELDPFQHTIQVYSGGYSDYLVEKTNRYEQQLEQFKQFDKKKKEMEAWIAEKRAQLRVHRNPKVARQLQAMKTRYDREMVAKAVEKPQEMQKIKINTLGEESYKKKVIFFIEDLEFKNIIQCKKLTLSGGDRIHLQGANGTGKTTFIKLLLNEISDYNGIITKGENIQVGYFAQHHEMLDKKKTVIEEFVRTTGIGEEQKVRKILGRFLFKGNHVFTKIGNLSQGEKVKLIIGELTYQNNQFLILDEPTNHLDIESREVLEEALREYKGGVLVISHDRYFLDQIEINRQLEIVNGTITERD